MRSLGVRLAPHCLPPAGATSPYRRRALGDWQALPLANPLTNGVALAELCAVRGARADGLGAAPKV
jgi:hypothetical protein